MPWFAYLRGIRRPLQYGGKMTVGEDVRGLDAGLEKEADAIAGQLLIASAGGRCSGELLRDAEAMASFGREIEVAPGIGMGRVRKMELIGWARCGELKVGCEIEGIFVPNPAYPITQHK